MQIMVVYHVICIVEAMMGAHGMVSCLETGMVPSVLERRIILRQDVL
jgi:hypothetical protein